MSSFTLKRIPLKIDPQKEDINERLPVQVDLDGWEMNVNKA